MLSKREPPQIYNTYRMKVRGWKKISHANGNEKKMGVPILT